MKKLLLAFFALLGCAQVSNAQVWSYNFGTTVDSITSGSATSPTTFPATADGGSSIYGRVGSGGGKLVMKSFSGIGSGSALRLQAPTGASVNKFSLYNIPSASTTLGIKLTFSIGDSANSTTNTPSTGNLYFFAGNGVSFYNNSGFSGVQTFTGIKMALNATNSLLYVRVPIVGWYTDVNNPITIPYGTATTVALYLNNGTAAVNYTDINGTSRSLAAGTCDIFTNGTFLVNIVNAGISTNTVLNSFMFYAESSTANEANVFIDDIVYTNNIVNNTLPIHLKSFFAKQNDNTVQLSWETGVETSLQNFIVEHSTTGNNFKEIGNVYSKHNIEGSIYSFTHTQPAVNNYYRLRIIDANGQTEYSQIVTARIKNNTNGLNAWYANGNLYLEHQQENTSITVYDVAGRKVYTATANSQAPAINLAELHEGNYIATIESGTERISVKFLR